MRRGSEAVLGRLHAAVQPCVRAQLLCLRAGNCSRRSAHACMPVGLQLTRVSLLSLPPPCPASAWSAQARDAPGAQGVAPVRARHRAHRPRAPAAAAARLWRAALQPRAHAAGALPPRMHSAFSARPQRMLLCRMLPAGGVSACSAAGQHPPTLHRNTVTFARNFTLTGQVHARLWSRPRRPRDSQACCRLPRPLPARHARVAAGVAQQAGAGALGGARACVR